MNDARAELPDDVDVLKALVLSSRAEVEHLKLIIAKLKRLQFGRRSEKIDREIEQLELRLEELQVSAVPATSRSAEKPLAQIPVRRPLPPHLPRTRVEHTPACTCPDCGVVMRKIGEDVAEILDYVPARFRVIQHVRPKLACPACERIVQLEAPSRPIARGLAGAGLLAHVLVSKYADHLPLYRQAQIYARQGINLDRSTLADWVGKSTALLAPLADAIGRHVLAGEAISPTTRRLACLDPGVGALRDVGREAARLRYARAGARSGPRPHQDGPALDVCAR